MHIGIIGAGNVGMGLAKRLIAKGHSLTLSFNRDNRKLQEAADSIGARAAGVSECADVGDVVVLATPWTVTPEALRQACAPARRKILWDCTNALKPDMSGLAVGLTTSGGEEVAQLAPWATVVKAIPPFAELLHSPNTSIGRKRPSVFVCGNESEAKRVIMPLVEDIGAAPVDSGPLRNARYAEPAAMLLVQLAYAQGLGGRIGVSLLRETCPAVPSRALE
jgi:8-hydroxy-5-deazaflavin:NADPH oxidoreductase